MEIKKVDIQDWQKLQQIGRQTFFETFSGNNSEENMKSYLDNSFSEQRLKMELENKHSEFYFIEDNNIVVGYLKLNYADAQTEIKDSKSLEIERIYVLKEYQGKKVGQTLYEKAIQIAKNMNMEYVWLGVWEKNIKAINFYKKNGFVEFDKHIFILGDDKQVDIMMKLEI